MKSYKYKTLNTLNIIKFLLLFQILIFKVLTQRSNCLTTIQTQVLSQNTAVPQGTAAFGPGKFTTTQGLLFDGLAGAFANWDASNFGGSDISLSFWLNISNIKNNANIFYVSDAADDNIISCQIDGTNQRFKCYFQIGANINSYWVNDFLLNEWNHFVVIISKTGEFVFFKNGVIINKTQVQKDMTVGVSQLSRTKASIGGSATLPTFQGSLEDLKIFDYELTIEEISCIADLCKNKCNQCNEKWDQCQTCANSSPARSAAPNCICPDNYFDDFNNGTCENYRKTNCINTVKNELYNQGKITLQGAIIITGTVTDTSLSMNTGQYAEFEQNYVGGGDVSVTFWAQFTALVNNMVIFEFYESATQRFGCFINTTGTNTIECYHYNGAQQNVRADTNTQPSVTINTTNLYNWTIVFESSGNIAIYQSGKLLATVTVNALTGGIQRIQRSQLLIGKQGGATAIFRGQIDDFRVFDRKLSIEEIKCFADVCDNQCQSCREQSNNCEFCATSTPARLTIPECKCPETYIDDHVNPQCLALSKTQCTSSIDRSNEVANWNTAVLLGSTTNGPGKVTNNAIVFDGTSYADMEQPIKVDSNISVAYWGFWNSVATSDARIFEFYYNGDFKQQFMCYNVGVTLHYRCEINYNGNTKYEVYLNTIELSVWIHFGITIDSTTGNWVVYKNGVVLGGAQTAPTLTPSDLNHRHFSLLYLGRNVDSSANFNGSIDDFRVFDIILTQEQIKCLADQCGNQCQTCQYSSDTCITCAVSLPIARTVEPLCECDTDNYFDDQSSATCQAETRSKCTGTPPSDYIIQLWDSVQQVAPLEIQGPSTSRAYQFAGGAYATFNDGYYFGGEDVTFSMWIRIDVAVPNAYIFEFSEEINQSEFVGLHSGPFGQGLSLIIESGGNFNEQRFSDDYCLVLGEWAHWQIIVRQAGTVEFYKDGILETPLNTIQNSYTGGIPLKTRMHGFIAISSDNTDSNFLEASIDYFRVFRRALTDTELVCMSDNCKLGCNSCSFFAFCFECLGNRIRDIAPDNDKCICPTGFTDHYPDSYFCSGCDETHFDVILQPNYKDIYLNFLVNLESLTYPGAITQLSTSLCNHILTTETLQIMGDQPICQYISADQRIIINLGRGATITKDDIIQFNSESLSIQGCVTSITVFNGQPLEIDVLGAIPSITLKMSQIDPVSICQDLTISIGSIENDGDRGLFNTQVILDSTDATDTTLIDELMTQITSLPHGQDFIVIPALTFLHNFQYIFKFTFENFLGQTNELDIVVNARAEDKILVEMEDHYDKSLKTWQYNIFRGNFQYVLCSEDGNLTQEFHIFKISWEDVDSGSRFEMFTENTVETQTSAQYIMEPFKKEPGSYTIQMVVSFLSLDPQEQIYPINYVIEDDPLFIKIIGGNRIHSFKDEITIQAVTRDIVLNPEFQPDGIIITWTCIDLLTSAACTDILGNTIDLSTELTDTIVFPSNTFKPFTTMEITIRGLKSLLKDTTHKVNLIITDEDIQSNQLEVTYPDQMLLGLTNLNDEIQIEISETLVVPSDQNIFTLSLIYKGENVGQHDYHSNQFSFKIKDLYDGITSDDTKLTIKVVYLNDMYRIQSYKYLEANINLPPILKNLQISPAIGEAYNTKFTIYFTQSSDQHFPLYYQYYIYPSPSDYHLEKTNQSNQIYSKAQLLQDYSRQSQLTTTLPIGHYNITQQKIHEALVLVVVKDRYGATSNLTQTVEINLDTSSTISEQLTSLATLLTEINTYPLDKKIFNINKLSIHLQEIQAYIKTESDISTYQILLKNTFDSIYSLEQYSKTKKIHSQLLKSLGNLLKTEYLTASLSGLDFDKLLNYLEELTDDQQGELDYLKGLAGDFIYPNINEIQSQIFDIRDLIGTVIYVLDTFIFAINTPLSQVQEVSKNLYYIHINDILKAVNTILFQTIFNNGYNLAYEGEYINYTIQKLSTKFIQDKYFQNKNVQQDQFLKEQNSYKFEQEPFDIIPFQYYYVSQIQYKYNIHQKESGFPYQDQQNQIFDIDIEIQNTGQNYKGANDIDIQNPIYLNFEYIGNIDLNVCISRNIGSWSNNKCTTHIQNIDNEEELKFIQCRCKTLDDVTVVEDIQYKFLPQPETEEIDNFFPWYEFYVMYVFLAHTVFIIIFVLRGRVLDRENAWVLPQDDLYEDVVEKQLKKWEAEKQQEELQALAAKIEQKAEREKQIERINQGMELAYQQDKTIRSVNHFANSNIDDEYLKEKDNEIFKSQYIDPIKTQKRFGNKSKKNQTGASSIFQLMGSTKQKDEEENNQVQIKTAYSGFNNKSNATSKKGLRKKKEFFNTEDLVTDTDGKMADIVRIRALNKQKIASKDEFKRNISRGIIQYHELVSIFYYYDQVFPRGLRFMVYYLRLMFLLLLSCILVNYLDIYISVLICVFSSLTIQFFLSIFMRFFFDAEKNVNIKIGAIIIYIILYLGAGLITYFVAQSIHDDENKWWTVCYSCVFFIDTFISQVFVSLIKLFWYQWSIDKFTSCAEFIQRQLYELEWYFRGDTLQEDPV